MSFALLALIFNSLAFENISPFQQLLGAKGFRFSGNPMAAEFSPQHALFSIVTSNGELVRIDSKTGTIRERRRLLSARPSAAAVSTDGLLIAASDVHGNLVIVAADGKSTIYSLGPESHAVGLAVSNAGSEPRVAVTRTVENGATPLVFSGPAFTNRRELYLFVRPAMHPKFSEDGKRLMFSGRGGVVVLGANPTESWEWRATPPTTTDLDAVFLGTDLVAFGDQREVQLWEFKKEVFPRTLLSARKEYRKVVGVVQTDRLLVLDDFRLGPADEGLSRLNLVATADGRTVRHFDGSCFARLALAAGPGLIASIGKGVVQRFSIDTGTEIDRSKHATSPVSAMDVSADGTIGAGYQDGSFRLFRPPSFEPILAKSHEFPRPIATVHACENMKWVVGRATAGLPHAPGDRADIYDAKADAWESIHIEPSGNFEVQRGAARDEVLLQVKQLGGAIGGPQPAPRPIRRFNIATRETHDIPTRLASIYGPIAWTPKNGTLLAAADMVGAPVNRMTPESIEFFDRDGRRFGFTPTIDSELIGIAFDHTGASLAVCQGVGKNNQVLNRISDEIADALITVRRVPSGDITGSLRLSGRPTWSRFDDDGTWLLVGFDYRVEIVELQPTPKSKAQIRADYVPSCGAWITPGKVVALGADDTRVRIYNVPP